MDGGSWITLQDGAGIDSGSTETYSAPAQADGVTINWQVRAGTSNPSSGSYTSATSRTVSGCTDTGVVSVATEGGSCATGSSTPKITITNGKASTQYFDIQYSTNGGVSWTTLQDGASISASSNDEFSLPSSVTDGTTVSFQYRYDTSNPSSGSYTAADSVTIDCPYINPAATQSFTTTCSAGARTNSLVLTNASPANTVAYFYVEYFLMMKQHGIQRQINLLLLVAPKH